MLRFLIATGLGSVMSAAGVHGALDFNRDVRPILSDKCFFCHGPDSEERKADLRLDTAEGAAAALKVENPEQGEFMARILSKDPDELMPPPESHKKLSTEEVKILTQWLQEGAVYARPWAYEAPVKHPTPEAAEAQWGANWIDAFVLARLESEQLQPEPDADAVSLARRLHFDLTGLPPSPESVAEFASNLSKDPQSAVESLVDQLLESPHHGERMAIYWLDLVRFADTVGYHGDQDHNASPYRDYVIDAFNRNLPFDQFTIEQLAGDLLPNPTQRQKVATCYNRLLQTSHEGGVQPKEYLAIYFADRVRNLSEVWMGATVGCAQCHDHKYDPYTIHDFYSLGAFFADVDETGHLDPARRGRTNFNTLPSPRPPEMLVLEEADQAKMAELKKELARETELGPPPPRVIQGIDAIEKRGRLSMVTVAMEKPRPIRVLPRGNWQDDSGELVNPAIPEFMGEVVTDGARPTRLDLARWLTDAKKGSGGLTARVMANRFWYLFFGTGLSSTLDDFGGQGEPPSHPRLLDRLAIEFVESGWDMRHLIRLLVTSRCYRQSSSADPALLKRDPDNRLFARQSRYRLPAEVVRDNALAISGLLVDSVGGASVKPYQPAGYYRHLNFPKRTYQQHNDPKQWRRGLYVHWQRQFLHPMMKAFDAPSREECTAKRPRSNTPLAALVLLNDPTFVEAARVFASRIISEGSVAWKDRLDFAFKQALQRSPDPEETEVLRSVYGAAFSEARNEPKGSQELLGTGLSKPVADIDPAEVYAWTAVARTLLNLSETVTRN
jgi:hypothetical protein